MAINMRRSVMKRELFKPWLVISVIWIGMVGYQTWRDVPRDDWLSEPSGSQLSDTVALLLYNPVANAVVRDAILLALGPPILALTFGSVLIWAVRKFSRQRK